MKKDSQYVKIISGTGKWYWLIVGFNLEFFCIFVIQLNNKPFRQ